MENARRDSIAVDSRAPSVAGFKLYTAFPLFFLVTILKNCIGEEKYNNFVYYFVNYFYLKLVLVLKLIQLNKKYDIMYKLLIMIYTF